MFESLNEYILSLTLITALSSAVLIFAPDNGIKKYLKYLVSMIIALALLMPLKDIIFTLPQKLQAISSDLPPSSVTDISMPTSEELIIGYTSQKLRTELEYAVSDRFGIKAEILPVFDYENISAVRLEKVIVKLAHEDSAYTGAVGLFIADKTGCAAEFAKEGEEGG